MKIKLFILLISNLIIMLSSSALADTMILKDGTVLQGIMKSATEFSIMFEVDGELKEV